MASVLVPLSMENESTSEIGAYINSSQVFGAYISNVKKDYLCNFEYFFKNETHEQGTTRASLFKAPATYLRQNTFQVGFVTFALSALYLTKRFSKSSKTWVINYDSKSHLYLLYWVYMHESVLWLENHRNLSTEIYVLLTLHFSQSLSKSF